MRTGPRIAIQDSILPGRDLDERFAFAAQSGFEGVELAVSAEADLENLVHRALHASDQSGIAVAALCTSSDHDPLHPVSVVRKRRFATLTALLGAADALGASGVVSVPLRPRFGAYDGEEPSSAIAALTEDAVEVFGEWAATLPVDGRASVFLEPLNRYEAKFLTRVGQGAAIVRRIDSLRVKVLGDVFHMNIEEASIPRALDGAGVLLGHVHLADNTRMLPGTGAFDFDSMFGALRQMDYTGWMALECFPPAGRALMRDPAVELPATVGFLRERWAEADRRYVAGERRLR